MEHYNWDSVTEEMLSPLISRQVIHTPDMSIIRITFKQGAIVALHHHVHEQITIPASGALRIDMEGREIVLRAGDVLRVPSDVPHAAEALEDTVSLDLFTPTRTDLQK